MFVFRGVRPALLNRTFRRLQIVSAALLSFSHGANDAKKPMAAITLALIAGGQLKAFKVPIWVVILSATAIGFGTYAGGSRIIRTLAWRIYKLAPDTKMQTQQIGA